MTDRLDRLDRARRGEAKNVIVPFVQQCKCQIKNPISHVNRGIGFKGWTHNGGRGKAELATLFRYMEGRKQGWSFELNKASEDYTLMYGTLAIYKSVANRDLIYIYNHGEKYLRIWWEYNRLKSFYYIIADIIYIDVIAPAGENPLSLCVKIDGDVKELGIRDTEMMRNGIMKELNILFPREISEIIMSYFYPRLDDKWLSSVIGMSVPPVPNIVGIEVPGIIPIPRIY